MFIENCLLHVCLLAYYFPNSLLKIILMLTFPNRSPLKSEPSDESDTNRKPKEAGRKKKKEKKKRRQREHHREARIRRGRSGSPGSEPGAGSERDRPSRGVRDSKGASEKLK